jgi:hypothetical protein
MAAKDSNYVVAAWGVEKTSYQPRAAHVRGLLVNNGIKVSCLGLTKAGCPRHPLYVRAETDLQRYKLKGY